MGAGTCFAKGGQIMDGVREFLEMGGYALYVWTSYGLTLIVLLINFYLPRTKEKALIRKLSKRSPRSSNQSYESKAT
jgi:heme exporter protein D